MSDLSAIGLLAAIAISGTFVIFYGTSRSREVAADIVTGVVHGHSVSMKHRWLQLYNVWVGEMTLVLILSLILALFFWQIGAHVSDERVRLLGYFLATLAGFMFFTGILRVVSLFVHHMTLLREIEAKS